MSNYLYRGILQLTDQGCVSVRSLVPYAVNQYIEITHLAANKGPLNIWTLMTRSPCEVVNLIYWQHRKMALCIFTVAVKNTVPFGNIPLHFLSKKGTFTYMNGIQTLHKINFKNHSTSTLWWWISYVCSAFWKELIVWMQWNNFVNPTPKAIDLLLNYWADWDTSEVKGRLVLHYTAALPRAV